MVIQTLFPHFLLKFPSSYASFDESLEASTAEIFMRPRETLNARVLSLQGLLAFQV